MRQTTNAVLRTAIVAGVLAAAGAPVASTVAATGSTATEPLRQAASGEPRPEPAIPAIVAALASHPVVAIAESHGLRQAGEFYVALVRDPGFQHVVEDLVVEFASRQSQPLLDRYVVRGDSLPPEELRSIWRNTTKTASWESPVYARWLAAVRDVNRSLPLSHRIRVLAGDTSVDWPRMHTHADWAALGDNNVSFASVIADDVLARHHRALVVLGSNHLARGGTRDGGPNTTTRLEAREHGALFVVWLYTGRPGGGGVDARTAREAWPCPALVALRGSWVGRLRAGARPLEDVADALLYVAPSSELAGEPAPPGEIDDAYATELDRRSWIEWGDSTRARRFLGLAERR